MTPMVAGVSGPRGVAAPVESTPARRGTGVMCLVLLGLTLGALSHVAVQAKRVDVGMQLGKEQKIQTDLQERRRRLEIEIGMLKAPGRLISQARDQLQMGPAAPTDIRVIGKERK